MSGNELLEVLAVGFLAGTIAGVFGVGGGVVFVPSLVFIFGMTQTDANATSLIAIVPVALVGSYRNYRYGNVVVREALWIGVVALPAALVGGYVANRIPEEALRFLFVGLAVYVGYRMARRALFPQPGDEVESPPVP
jgi:uncharacterized membrane protein YfcA